MDERKCLLLMDLPEGHTFRHMMHIISGETAIATMLLYPNRIDIKFENTERCCIHMIELDTEEFSQYTYDFRDEKGELYERFPISFDTTQMNTTLKSASKNASIRINLYEGDNKLNIRLVNPKTSDKHQSAMFVNIRNDEYSVYDNPKGYGDKPDMRMQATTFTDMCTRTTGLKCNYLEIICAPEQMVFRGMKEGSGEAFIDNCPVQNATVVNTTTIRIPSRTAKALSKFHHISTKGTNLQWFFSLGKPTKIKSTIGAYGTYELYLKNVVEPEVDT